jgi:hypothetical protein
MTEKDVPDAIKEDNWRLFEQAMSPDPAVGPQYCVKMVTHLMLTMKIAGITEYDQLLKEALEKSRMALAAYVDTEQAWHEGEAIQTSSEAIAMFGHLLYDERFSTRDKHAFTGRSG